jgi:hypothetical protein
VLKIFAAAALLAVLALLSLGKVVAGPPEGASGKMKFDEVADGLRKYRNEIDPVKRIEWLKKLAPTHDPRVGVALGEYYHHAFCVGDDTYHDLIGVIITHYASHLMGKGELPVWVSLTWWEENEADLRRRAAQLPR